MSSILDALGKLESSPRGGPGGPPPSRPRRWLPVLGAVVVAFAAGLGVMRLLEERPAADPESEATVTAAATPTPEPTARPMGRLVETQPTTTLARPTTTTPPPAPPPTAIPPSTFPPAAAPTTPPTTTPVPPPPTTLPPRRAAPTTAPPTVPPRRPASPRPTGAPDVRVSFLLYSSTPARRSVALTIGEGGMSSLREGEYFQGVRVLEILPDAVDLEWAGVRYRVPAGR